jgi:hypothetical protein
MVLIGIGNAGANLVDEFGKHHKKITITSEDFPKHCKKTEDYEEYCPKFTKKLKPVEGECWVAVCGADKVAGCTLAVLEKIKDKKINVIYICPDRTMRNAIQLKQHKVCFNVLQQYARSGLIHRIFLFSNKEVLNIIGNQTITTMYKNINKQIANAVETFDWFTDQEPVMGSSHEAKNISRICTLSVGDFKKNEEKMLFLLDNVTETSYIYIISKQQLEKNKDLLNQIKSKVIKDEENNITSSFTIYSSDHSQSFFYSLKLTHFIQQMEQ